MFLIELQKQFTLFNFLINLCSKSKFSSGADGGNLGAFRSI